jgi:hypothetical protein
VRNRGPHHAVWATANGGYVQIETGLNCLDEKGTWRLSGNQIELFEQGAVYRQGQFGVLFSPNIADPIPVHIRTPDGTELKTRVLGLAFYDPASAESVMIAEIRDAVGELLPSRDAVIYPDAFADLTADIIYRITKATCDQDIVFREQIPSPEDYGLPATSLLLALTEFIDAPAPQEVAALTVAEPVGPGERTNRVDASDLPAGTLTFGGMTIGAGKAFLSGETGESVAVQKSWKLLDNRQFLIESVAWPAVREPLRTLPKGPGTALDRPRQSLEKYVQATAARKGLSRRAGDQIRYAGTARLPQGLVLDYSAVLAATNGMMFQSDTTYFVSGLCVLSGTSVIEGNCVVKFAATNAQLRIQGALLCNTGPWNPAILTSCDDQTVGESIAGSNPSPSGYYAHTALDIMDNTTDLKHLRIAWAGRGIVYESGSGWPHALAHVQFVNCGLGVTAQTPAFWVRNALFSNVATNFTTSTNGVAGYCEHLTVDRANYFNGAAGLSLYVTNSLLVAVTNAGTYSGSGNATATDGATVFASAAAGAYYLPPGSAHRDAGVSDISYPLSVDFNNRTTDAPVVLSNATVSVDAVWGPQAQRDVGLRDRGYHYPALDYLRNNLFWRGAIRCYYNTAGATWEAKDNAFDNVALTNGAASFVNANNGYINATQLSGGSSNVVVGAFAYTAGPLGAYYQASTNFYDCGSRTAGAAGLYHHTTRLDQGKELNSTVDIGFHVVAATPAEAEVAKTLIAATASTTWSGWAASNTLNGLSTDPGWHNTTYTGTNEYVRFDLTNATTLSRLGYVPRVMTTNGLADGSRNGVYRQFEVYVTDSSSGTPSNWGSPVAAGEWTWPNLQERHDVNFVPKSGRYLILRRITAYGWYSSEDPNYRQYGYPGYANANEVWLYRRCALTPTALDTDGDGLADYFEDRNGNGTYDSASGESDWTTSPNGTGNQPGLEVFTPME